MPRLADPSRRAGRAAGCGASKPAVSSPGRGWGAAGRLKQLGRNLAAALIRLERSDTPEQLGEELARDKILVGRTGPGLGSHVGPGFLGVALLKS